MAELYYRDALKLGQKEYRACASSGRYPYLPVLDDFERAIAMLANSEDEAAKEGTNLIYNKLMGYLKTKGLSVIEAKGEKFDVDFHEAAAQFPAQDESQKGMVIDVVQTGYLLNGKVLRYAKVVVGA